MEKKIEFYMTAGIATDMDSDISFASEIGSIIHQFIKRYYMEGTHEGIVSRETWELAQQIREQRRNKKIAGSKKPVYPFTSMIECGCCGKHYQHKVNNSGKKWRNDIWVCATQLRKGLSAT